MKTARPPSWQILLAFAIIYFVWGSTFLAIRVGVREVPPFLLAAMRFFAAGLILYVWMRLKGSPSPTILTKRIPLPASKPMSAAAQMLTGGVQLFIVAAI